MYLVLVDAMDRSFVAKSDQIPKTKNGMNETQTTKRLILFSQKQTFHWSKTEKKTCFGPIKKLFSFSTAHTEKNWRKQN